MFKLCSGDVISIPSNWQKTFATNEIQTQTDVYKIVHRGINVKRQRDKDCQTDDYLFVEEDIQADVDELELVGFLNKVEPLMTKVLMNNDRSQHFKQIESESVATKSNKCIFSIETQSEMKNICSLSWNCNGTVLAAAYGDISHSEWCCHTGTGIAIYSLGSLEKSMKPDLFLETTSCCNSVQFHPSLPGIFSAGTHNGELLIWDRTRDTNDILIATTSNKCIHEDCVEIIRWLPKSKHSSTASSSNHKLLSISNDGIIVLWNLSLRKSTLTPLNCGKLSVYDLPKYVRQHRTGLGGTICCLCGDVNVFDSEYFLVGTDIGVLFQCRIKGKTEDHFVELDSCNFKSPVDTAVFSISGSIHGVCWSRTLSNLATVASANGLIYALNIERKQILLTIDPNQSYLYNISMSKQLAGFVATGGGNGSVVLTDICSEQQNQTTNEDDGNNEEVNDEFNDDNILTVDSNKTSSDGNVRISSVEFNDFMPQFIAYSTDHGNIYIWELGQNRMRKMKSNKSELSRLTEMLGDTERS